MSVLKSKRRTSNVQFIATAYTLETETVNFLTHLSAKHSRILSPSTSQAAMDLVNSVIMANKIFPSDQASREQRKLYLLEALGHLDFLDAQLTLCYEIMRKNPQGCFENTKDKPVPSNEAIDKLDKMSEKVGDLLNEEEALIKGVLNSDQRRQQ